MPRSFFGWALYAVVICGVCGIGCSKCGRTSDAEDIANKPPPPLPSGERLRRAPIEMPGNMRRFQAVAPLVEAGHAAPSAVPSTQGP